MKPTNMAFITSLLVAVFLAGCSDEPETLAADIDCEDPGLTKEERQQGNCLWDMGQPTDRSKNQEF